MAAMLGSFSREEAEDHRYEDNIEEDLESNILQRNAVPASKEDQY